MKPALEDMFMGPLASPSFSEGLRFRWEDSRRRVHVVFGGMTIADSRRVMLLHEFGRRQSSTSRSRTYARTYWEQQTIALLRH